MYIALIPLILPAVQAFFFQWPATTQQCQIVTLTWSNAIPPFSAVVAPMMNPPFIYDIPSSAYVNGQGSYQIQLQAQAGQNYVVWMSDGTGLGSGGSSEIQTVGNSTTTSCLATAGKNQTALDYTFSIAGVAEQCQSGFEVAWTGTGDEPYNFTLVPLDQGFIPFDVPLDDTLHYEKDWVMNITGGEKFSIMMNSKKGRGSGGIGGVYQVKSSSQTSCLLEPVLPTGTWPENIATDTIASGTLPITSPTGSTSSSHSSSSKTVSGGAIAGIVIGVIAFIAICSFLCWYLLKGRRLRTEKVESMNLDGEVDPYAAPTSMIEPYRVGGSIPSPVTSSPGDSTGLLGDPSSGSRGLERRESGTTGSQLSDERRRTVGSSAGFAGLGAGGIGVKQLIIDREDEEFVQSAPETSTAQQQNSNPKPLPSPLPLPSPSSSNTTQPLRVFNHDDSNPLPVFPENTIASPTVPNGRVNRRSGINTNDHSPRGPTFRRHADAGRIPETIDLPPLYTDVPRSDNGPGDERDA